MTHKISSTGFEIVPGSDLDAFLEDGLTAPGGREPLLSCRPGVDGLWWAEHARITRSPARRRWRKAQRHELKFWRGWRQHPVYRDTDLTAYWRRIEELLEPLPEGRALDVGCGPVSILDHRKAALRECIGVDPLAADYRREGLLEGGFSERPLAIAACPGEALPFGDGSFDLVLALNMLDHVDDPQPVLAEIRRVLRSGGRARVMVFTFSPWLRPLLVWDPTHPHHWTERAFTRVVRRAGFAITAVHREAPRFRASRGRRSWRWLPYRWAESWVRRTILHLELPPAVNLGVSIS